MVVGVLVELSNKNIDRVFDYLVPLELVDKVKLGIKVKVPFSRQILEGFIVEVKDFSNSKVELREVISIVDDEVILNDELLELGKKIKASTLATLISCYQVMLPKALKAKNGSNVNIKYDICYRLNDVDLGEYKITLKQRQIIDLFKDRELILRNEAKEISLSSLKTLLDKKILVEKKCEHYRLKYNKEVGSKKVLTLDQKNVVSSVDLTRYFTYLLYGVTGSGKTEVYMELIDKVLSMGKSSIVLVPEISLTPQMVSRFEMRFGKRIAALHSALSDGERYDEWRRIARGEASIVIGARSAIFAPLKNIGIIIIDEEHSDSYKQDDTNPRYSAKEVAFMRGQYHNCPVLMGSATPTLDSYARANKGVYKLLNLSKRINGKALPKVSIIDMNENFKSSKGHFSLDLINAIEERLTRREQVILFLNRRGYSSFVTCKNCGYTFKCPDCDITLTYHKSSNTLRCHYCGYGTKVYNTCPKCGEDSINDLGVGTEKIEEELKVLFKNSKVLRMDFDTTSRKGSHEKMIKAFRNCEYDILLGTQIVAKGLDFDNVTLVGVINGDTSLMIPDFRSSENTFALLSQVAGRSGRSNKTGEVIIQTFNPEHYAISYAKSHDYIGFYKQEMLIRKKLKYPPYYYICYLRISGLDSKNVLIEANKIKKSLDRNLSDEVILGPSPCSISKVRKMYRYGIIVKYKRGEKLLVVLEKILDYYKTNNKVVIDIDFNPSHF